LRNTLDGYVLRNGRNVPVLRRCSCDVDVPWTETAASRQWL